MTDEQANVDSARYLAENEERWRPTNCEHGVRMETPCEACRAMYLAKHKPDQPESSEKVPFAYTISLPDGHSQNCSDGNDLDKRVRQALAVGIHPGELEVSVQSFLKPKTALVASSADLELEAELDKWRAGK